MDKIRLLKKEYSRDAVFLGMVFVLGQYLVRGWGYSFRFCFYSSIGFYRGCRVRHSFARRVLAQKKYCRASRSDRALYFGFFESIRDILTQLDEVYLVYRFSSSRLEAERKRLNDALLNTHSDLLNYQSIIKSLETEKQSMVLSGFDFHHNHYARR